MNEMHKFSHDKQRAIEQLREMNKRAVKTEPLTTDGTAQNSKKASKNLSDNFKISMSSDDILIVALILILSQDCHDKWLFLALFYILM